ncbi:MAG: AMP-binding protein, partial [Gammaproteobacteria bacterium]|nr:AMP-binding protein [Gammaproteobacteria bacterium]
MNSCSEGHKFISCYLIGEDSLAGSCVKTILECGYVLLGICSHSEQIKDFAAQKNIPCTNSIEVFASWVRANKCDFLFSIVNSRILSKDLITLPRYFAINYHNAVLPKYAGVHATSWALLNNEQFHGVTWHVMAEGIDTGDILKQATFKIDDQETNFTLDVKCIEKAVPLFRELLAELVEGKYKRIKQDLDRRSYYTLYQKPKHWGVVTWVSSTASEIYRLHRALNFVGRANKLCLPKFIFNEAPFFAKHVTILNKKKKYSPGTIIELSDKYLRVATLTEDIGLSQLTDINGKSYGAAELAAFVGFKKGEKLSSLKKEFLQQLELHGEQLVKDESFWIRALEQIKNLEFGIFNSHEDVVHKETNIIKTLIYADKSFKNKISLLLPATSDTTHALMAIFLLYLYRLNNYDDFSVGYSNQYLKKLETDMDNFFADIVPMNLCFTPNIGWRQAAVKVTGLLNLIEKHKTFAKDVVLRYPQLSEQLISYPIIISTTEPHKKMLDRIKNSLYFVINEDSINLYFSANLDATKQKIIDSMSGHLQILVDKLLLNNKQAIGNLSILTAQEEQLILEDWNNTTRPYPRDLSVAQLFEQQVDKYPNNVAVKCKNILLTYRELNQKANQLGFYLSSLGIKGGSLVATYFDKGINSIIGILSVLKTGAAYIPIDPMYPKQHIRYILEDTGVFIILTQEKNRKTLEECLPSGKFILLSVDNANANQN